jgi:hypothetical protein
MNIYPCKNATNNSKNQKGRASIWKKPVWKAGISVPIYTATAMSIAPTNILRNRRIESEPIRMNSPAKCNQPINTFTDFSAVLSP